MSDSNQKNSVLIRDELASGLKTFCEESREIVNDWLSELERCHVPKHIYHYTNDKGLIGILKSGKFWLTDIFSLNDPSELRHGISLATKTFDIKAKKISRKCTIISKKFKDALDDRIQKIAHFFVCSFSRCGDDLGQWRAYADNGRGFALCFDAETLEKMFISAVKTKTSDGETFPVTYDDSRLVEIYEKILDKALPHISFLAGADISTEVLVDHLTQLYKQLAVRIVTVSLYFKHKGYVNEDEYRFFELHAANTQPEISYRTRHYSLIKYREFDWKSAGTDVLKQIVIGPAADLEKSKRFAEDCLREAGIDPANVTITQSQIPYKPA